jgi:hypothetical protein
VNSLMIGLTQAKQRLAAARAKKQALATAEGRAQADVSALEDKAAGAAAACEIGGIDEAPILRRIAQDADAALDAGKRILRSARDAHSHANAVVNAALEIVRDAKSKIHQAHLDDELVARLNQLRAEERRLAFLLSAARLRDIWTASAEEALDGPPARPTSAVTMPNPGIVADINTSLQSPQELGAADRYWRARDADLERAIAEPAPATSSREQAA